MRADLASFRLRCHRDGALPRENITDDEIARLDVEGPLVAQLSGWGAVAAPVGQVIHRPGGGVR